MLGDLGNLGGKVRFPEVGTYTLTASAVDALGREYSGNKPCPPLAVRAKGGAISLPSRRTVQTTSLLPRFSQVSFTSSAVSVWLISLVETLRPTTG